MNRREVGRPLVRARTSLRPALLGIGLLTLLLAVVQWVLIWEQHPPFGWLLESFGLVGFVTVAVGLWLWDRRPSNRIGLLIVTAGALELLASIGNTANPWLGLIGVLAAEAPIAALTHLVLAFPAGRLRTRLDRALVATHYVASVALQIPIYVFDTSNATQLSSLRVEGGTQWVKRADDLQGLIAGVVLLVAAWIVLQRWRRTALASQRRALAAVYVYGIFVLVSFPLTSRVLRPNLDWSVYTLFGLQLLIILGVPFVYGIAMLTGGLARTVEVGELGTWLTAADGERPDLAEALGRALGDPSLELLFPIADGDEYVDIDGVVRPLTLGGGRASVTVSGSDGPNALIVYDAGSIHEPELVAAAGNVVSLAIDRERLTAELRASEAALRESRLRIIEQGERRRRELARDLHDAVQGRLVLAALHAGQLESDGPDEARVRTLRAEIDGAINELRRLSQGVLPALLVERGLYAAAEDLVDRLPIATRLDMAPDGPELSWQLSSAGYFVLAEALANTVKHAKATQVDVRLRVENGALRVTVTDDGIGGALPSGSGLRGLADRVAALDGRLSVRSPHGGGTTLIAEFPCGS